MKNTILLSVILLLLFSCNNNSDINRETSTKDFTEIKTDNKSKNLQGAWQLVSFYNYVNDKIKDSTISNANQKQIKLFTDGKFMWSKKRPADSTEWFAFGKYNINDNILTEHVEYGSLTMDNIMKLRKTFEYELILSKNKFSQVELDENGSRIYSENYIKLE
tara:strand:+ start:211404 stop:211889 length:486 start_codon:yes stop_codon:yes gene_type:complete